MFSNVSLTNLNNVETKSELFARLHAFDILVPLRTEGRTTYHAERWTICRLLSTLAKSESLCYPITLTHQDRPDFILQCHESNIGIEVTEAIPEQYAAYTALAEHQFPDTILEPGHFRWESAQRTTQEMRGLLGQKQLTSQPWMGDSAECEWASYFQSVIETKVMKIANLGFQLFQDNSLAIYDNLPVPHINLNKAINFLLPKLDGVWKSIPSFNAIYIEHGNAIVKITQTKTIFMDLCDLWSREAT